METIACTLGGLILIVTSLALARLKSPQWLRLGEGEQAAQRQRESVQSLIRRANNAVLGVTGGLIIATGWVPHGKTWMMLWGGVIIALFVAIVLAGFDACSSLVGYKRSIPEVARRSFSREQV
jgi:hypothetical protein